MKGFDDSLRGYSFEVHKRDDFMCRYCGLDGAVSLESWLSLSRDHLLPKGHAERENDEFIVTACMFCNTADNRYFENAEERNLQFDGMTQEQLVVQRNEWVQRTRSDYRDFWEKNVAKRRID